MELINKLFVCEEDQIQPEYIINYGSLVQEAMGEYHNIVDSKWWDPTDIKEMIKMRLCL